MKNKSTIKSIIIKTFTLLLISILLLIAIYLYKFYEGIKIIDKNQKRIFGYNLFIKPKNNIEALKKEVYKIEFSDTWKYDILFFDSINNYNNSYTILVGYSNDKIVEFEVKVFLKLEKIQFRTPYNSLYDEWQTISYSK